MNISLLVVIILLAVLLFVKVYNPIAELPLSFTRIRGPIILAHRGSRVLNPENTFLAFQNALDFGADVLETDVQLTKDGQLVIFHDDTLERVSNGVGKVSDFTVAELKLLDAGYKFTHDNGTTFPFRGKGINIPTPSEVFDAFPNTFFNIEIKNQDLLAATLLYEAIIAKGMQQKVAISGRWCDSVRHFRYLSTKDKMEMHTSACEGEVITFVVHSAIGTAALWFTHVSALDTQALQVPTASGPLQLDTPALLSALRGIGKHVHFWVINDADEMRRLLKLGANGLITDRPDIAVQVYEELGLKEKVQRDIYQYENSRYFVPVDTHVEVHTCVGLLCVVLQKVTSTVLWTIFCMFLVIIIGRRKLSAKIKGKKE